MKNGTMQERVARGTALLDAMKPGWWRDVDITNLDLSLGTSCVLGQVYGTFDVGKARLNLSLADASRHGFYHSDILTIWVSIKTAVEYETLTAIWRDVIQQKRLAEMPVKVKTEETIPEKHTSLFRRLIGV